MRALLALLFCCVFLTGALAQQQALRPGDTVTISVWQDPKLDRRVVVGPDGYIGFPLVGQVRASGLTPQALENLLRGRLQKNYTGQLDVTVALADINRSLDDENKPKIYITGEVLRPGPVFARPTINVMQAISLAGGFSPFAARQRIQLHRKVDGVDSIFVFNYNDYASGTNTADNISLHSGDILIVPERGLFE
jgi:polysaccharide export outer membrane protein